MKKRACLFGASGLLLTVLLSGCGTVGTRLGHTSFGAYPYQAIATDVEAVAEADVPGEIRILAFLSFPFDLVLDTLLLPPDLILWAAGHKKDGLGARM